ncbi:hypothetical protein RJ640_023747 [Escallonia rubra]|uniref:Uncharacterized protein n=1 Tax=Escallonia rubra TaxID=112253 RepID=A0AA88UHR4_9ASTE|nr:hypothetical protein RJ640_023747 [Escallonia rubra]
MNRSYLADSEYGTAGIVTTIGDVYSYGILLMETFTRKKPTDDLFVGELTMKKWVSKAFSKAVISIVDANLLTGEKEDFAGKESCLTLWKRRQRSKATGSEDGGGQRRWVEGEDEAVDECDGKEAVRFEATGGDLKELVEKTAEI